MANSLNFLNKPAPAKQQPIGPQPKPSTAAPKAFLDKSNPWAVGGGAPTASAIDRQARDRQAAAPRSTPVAQPARAPVQAAAPRSTPEPRQAAPARAPARPAPQPAPTPVQMVAPRPTPAPQPAPWQMAPTAEQAMAMRPQQAAPRPTPAPQPAPWQMAPTAEQAMAMRPMGQPATRGAPAQPSYSPLATVAAPVAPTAPATPPATPPTAAQPQATGPFYGYAPPGPLTAPRPFTAQRNQLMPYMTDRPNFSNLGQRALMTDEALAVEDARRQRDQAGGFGALQRSGTFRPWNSYSPAEKYLRRYGVMPPGEQIAPPTSGAEAMAENRAQTERLTAEYRARYGRYPKWDNYDYRQAPAPAPAAATTATSTAAASTAWAAPVSVQAQVNNAALAQVNPAAVRNGAITNAVTENDLTVVTRQILQRYRPELSTDGMTFIDMTAILAQYIPPQDRAQMYNDDAEWLSGFLVGE